MGERVFLRAFIGANLSEERFFPEPLSKDFQTDFSPDIVLLKTKKPVVNLLLEHYIWGKMKPKVLGREFEGEPFFKRVSLNRHA